MSSVLSVNDNTVRAALSGRALSRRVKLVFGFSVGLSRATVCIVNSLSLAEPSGSRFTKRQMHATLPFQLNPV